MEDAAHACADHGGIVRIAIIAGEKDAAHSNRLGGAENRSQISRRANVINDPASRMLRDLDSPPPSGVHRCFTIAMIPDARLRVEIDPKLLRCQNDFTCSVGRQLPHQLLRKTLLQKHGAHQKRFKFKSRFVSLDELANAFDDKRAS